MPLQRLEFCRIAVKNVAMVLWCICFLLLFHTAHIRKIILFPSIQQTFIMFQKNPCCTLVSPQVFFLQWPTSWNGMWSPLLLSLLADTLTRRLMNQLRWCASFISAEFDLFIMPCPPLSTQSRRALAIPEAASTLPLWKTVSLLRGMSITESEWGLGVLTETIKCHPAKDQSHSWRTK